ncbi:hypothetical protein OCL06_09690 [Alteromonas sp. ASW11-19]|uniref:Pilus assembly protein CpaE n=1 Tax=Alteromonas salexigens TaxID=2982530 RepID=A0ABT2VNI9_9ALTE|nr:hypothetical protein [Alteromonas salexigens]MCU7554870.1 hypothetical protein [Alteromonas salexigens]
MNNESTSCVIDYPTPVVAAQKLSRPNLSSRLNVLIMSTSSQVKSLVGPQVDHDDMLEATFTDTLPKDLSKFHVAVVYVESPAGASTLLQRLVHKVPHRLLICENLTTEIAKLAVQHKVDDLLPATEVTETLHQALVNIADAVSQSQRIAPLTSIINGKAGSGATFITCCMSEVFSELTTKQLALLDADFNYPSLAHGLRFESRFTIDQAIGELEKLDEAAIRSMMTSKDTTHLIGNTPFSRLKQDAHSPQNLNKLSWKIRQAFDEVFVDMSKGLEYQTLPLLSHSSTILVVMQLSVASLRETKAMLTELRSHIDMSSKKVAVIINRFVPDQGEITLGDVQSVLGIKQTFTIGNNFALAKLRTDLGRPLESLANHKKLSAELERIVCFATEIKPDAPCKEKAGFFRRLLRSR